MASFLFHQKVSAAETLVKEQIGEANDIIAMDMGQTLDGYAPNQNFVHPITNLKPTKIILRLRKDPNTTCLPFYVCLLAENNQSAVCSNERISLTSDYADYEVTFPALDSYSYPDGTMNLYQIQLDAMTNSGYCRYFTKGSDTQLEGESFNNSAFGFSMYYKLYGELGEVPEDNPKLYSLNIIYPQPDKYPDFTLATNDAEPSTHYTFKLHYSLSNDYFRDKRHIVALVSLHPDFSEPSAQFDELISQNDPDNTRTLTVPDILASKNVPTYYIFGIMDYTNPNYPDGHLVVALSIAINASSTLTNLHPTDWGFFGNLARDIFLPTANTKQKLIDLKDNLMGKWLFGYIKDNIDTVYNSYQAVLQDGSKPDIIYSFALHGTEAAPTDFNLGEMKVLDTSEPLVQSYAQALRPYLVAILWFFFFLYVFWRVFYFDHLY